MMKTADLRAIANKQQREGPAMPTATPVNSSCSKNWTSKDYWFYGLVAFFGLSALGSIGKIMEDPAVREARMVEQARHEQVSAIEQKQVEVEDAGQAKEIARLARLDACTEVEHYAYAYSQAPVRARLKAPSTASFPWTPEASRHGGDCKFKVLAYVDSQNGFGAMIRTAYIASLTYDPKTESWRLISLDMDR